MFGQPTRKEFDEVTRQLTELRREVRVLGRQLRAQVPPVDNKVEDRA